MKCQCGGGHHWAERLDRKRISRRKRADQGQGVDNGMRGRRLICSALAQAPAKAAKTAKVTSRCAFGLPTVGRRQGNDRSACDTCAAAKSSPFLCTHP